MKNRLLILISVLIVSSMLLSACGSGAVETVIVEIDGETVVQTVVVEVEKEAEAMMKPVTLNWNFATEPPSADPSLATDTTSVDLAGNLFVGLTKFHPVSGELQPYLATEWSAGEDADGKLIGEFKSSGVRPHFLPRAAYFGLERALLEVMNA